MPRLTKAALADPPAGLRVPAYDRGVVTPGIVHLGIGAFHRAHMAAYVDDLLAADPAWGIVGISLRRPDTVEALAPQDFLYTLAERHPDRTDYRVIGSLLDIVDANTDPDRVLEALCDPRVRIVSLTVTEKGYCHDPATGELNERHPDIVHDLAQPGKPRSAPGVIARAIALRRGAGAPVFAVMSCDNLPANGATCRRVVAGYADLLDEGLGTFVRENVAFPSTMVDRIVPSTTAEDRKTIAAATGLDDAWPVVTEPYCQWVIEDWFPSGRPAFEETGAQLVEDVADFELMKLRMLNGSHSTMAYLGVLAGHDYVADAIADADMRALIHGLMTEEVVPSLLTRTAIPRPDLLAYRDALLDRFANPALRHRTTQIAMDGTQKLPQRLLGTIDDLTATDAGYRRLALGVAAWMRYATGVDEQGRVFEVKDPLAPRLREIAAEGGRDAEKLAAGFFSLHQVFGAAHAPALREAVVAWLHLLLDEGARATIARASAV